MHIGGIFEKFTNHSCPASDLEYVYNWPNPYGATRAFLHWLIVHRLGSVVVGCVYKDLHELLLGGKSIGNETGHSR